MKIFGGIVLLLLGFVFISVSNDTGTIDVAGTTIGIIVMIIAVLIFAKAIWKPKEK